MDARTHNRTAARCRRSRGAATTVATAREVMVATSIVVMVLVMGTFAMSAAPAEAPATRVRIRTPAGAEETLDGRIIVEAADGGLLLETADTRYVTVQPDLILARETIPADPSPAEPRELARTVLAELPAGFDVHVTRHYVICFDTSRDYARWAAGLFERLHEAFTNYWTRMGLDLTPSDRPLMVVIFADRRGYEAYAARDLGAAADRVVGYYNLLSNRIATYDLTGSAALPRRNGRNGPAVADILAQPEAAGLVSTLVHEATHQLAFNTGMHRRLAPVPVWVSEGIATVFETPDLRSPGGWRGIGMVNRTRLDRFRRTFQPGDLARLVADDDLFRNAETALDAYAGAWALTWFLMETRRPQFVAYLRRLGAKPPLAADSGDRRTADFTASFGITPAELEPLLLRHAARLELRRP
jgi:hypothetical protein